MSAGKGNDLDAPIARFCLVLEEDRRTPEGRIRSSKQFREHYFPYDRYEASDQLFHLMPNDVRGPILAAWGIRGPRSAANDDDDRVKRVVHDALLAGDIDDFFFEEGILPAVVIRWSDLALWWKFWRRGPLTRHAMRRALETAHAHGLFDSKWFLDTLESRGGKVRGIDVLCDALTKTDMAEWIHAIHDAGDASAKGLVGALGWEKIAGRTADDALLSVLDAIAQKSGLVSDEELEATALSRRSNELTEGGPPNHGGGDVVIPPPPSTGLWPATQTKPAAAPTRLDIDIDLDDRPTPLPPPPAEEAPEEQETRQEETRRSKPEVSSEDENDFEPGRYRVVSDRPPSRSMRASSVPSAAPESTSGRPSQRPEPSST